MGASSGLTVREAWCKATVESRTTGVGRKPNLGEQMKPCECLGLAGTLGGRRARGLQRLGRVLTVCGAGAPGVCFKGSMKGTRDRQAAAKPEDEFIIPASSPGWQVSPVAPVLQSHKLNSHRKAR